MFKNLYSSYYFYILLAFIPTQEINAEIYRWVDLNGKVHYSDKPPKHLKVNPKTAHTNINESYDEVHLGNSKSTGVFSYVFISFSIPNSNVNSVIVKKTPKSECDKWRNDYYKAASDNCAGCDLLANECKEAVSDEYMKAFNKEKINSPYIFKPFKFPELLVYEGELPSGAFNKLCEVQKESLNNVLCIE